MDSLIEDARFASFAPWNRGAERAVRRDRDLGLGFRCLTAKDVHFSN